MAKMTEGRRVVAQNRRAFHDYAVEERFEAHTHGGAGAVPHTHLHVRRR